MSNLHRIQWLDSEIRSLRYPNSTILAAQFSISTRQAARDIEYLKYSLGAPLAYSAEQRGYYYTAETFTLPALFIGREEKAALGYLAEQYRRAGHGLTTQLANLFARLSGQDTDGVAPGTTADTYRDVPVYTIRNGTLRLLNMIKEAIESKKKIRLGYLDQGHNRTERIVHPYLLFQERTHTYLQCFCELRQAERSLRLDRIAELTLLTEDFILPAHFNNQPFIRGDFRFNYRLPYKASVRFDGSPPASALADFHPLPLRPEAGSTDYVLEFYQSQKLLAALVLTGLGFTILSPDWLRQRYRDFLTVLLCKNT